MLRNLTLTVVLAAMASGAVGNAEAQTGTTNSSARNFSTTRYLASRPTVSPYLNLVGDQENGGFSRYHTLVRPQLDQRRQAQEQQAAIARLNAQVSGVQSQLRRNTVPGQPTPTGHMTRFMTHSHYYPGLITRQR